ncbi:DNA polymerase IV [Williamsoniiplasma somnilux]|uniref:DNA polymerase IV n=1 Tax=Williamsoniiplasma somnilux TaxID=215578 RepID=A0A2K8P179_9MOLU|nr:DNA polymerase IV [Williamsoniiplasma somnilux]ATZ18761.1 DNA polymerase IV [Williamsoniiplasma somnilux]
MQTSIKKEKIIFHIDMDAFFASCTQAKYKQLRNKPIAIAYNNKHSIIVAASYESRKYGIKSAMNLVEAKKKCPNLIVVEPEHSLYIETSKKIWELIGEKFSKKIEVASIDECYLDVSDLININKSVKTIALEIQHEIYSKFKLTCSIGISWNKFLAKMGTDLQKPSGITILTPQNFKEKIWNLNIGKMIGVGNVTGASLIKNDINTIGELAQISDAKIYEILGRNGLILKQKANGIDDSVVSVQNNENKSISNEVTLNRPTNNLEELEAIVKQITEHIFLRINIRNLLVKTVFVHVRYVWKNKNNETFNITKHHLGRSKQITLENYENNFEILYASILECFYYLQNPEKDISLIGVGFTNLINVMQYNKQISFEDDPEKLNLTKPKVLEIIRDMNKKSKNLIITADKLQTSNPIQKKFIDKNIDKKISNKKK